MSITVRESLRQFLVEQSAQFQAERTCRSCGTPLKFIDATFCYYESDESWTIPMPVCPFCQCQILVRKKLPMNTVVSDSVVNPWKDAYKAALFEADQNKLQDRIADAEIAVVLRGRELFQVEGDHIEEQTSLDDALYALQALRNAARTRQTPSIGEEALWVA